MRTTRALLLAVPLAGACLAALGVPSQDPPAAKPAYAVLAPLDGTWKGEFFVRRPDGTLVQRLQVTQTYRKASDALQTCVMENRDGEKSWRETAENRIGEDGALSCVVMKADGSVVTHRGRSEGDQLFWSSVHGPEAPGGLRVESFRERVAGDEYRIDGFGVYGDAVKGSFLFHGVYRRVRD